MQKLKYWTVFIIAVMSLSEFFGGHKYLNGDSTKAMIMIPASMLVFLLCIFYLGYQVYKEEKEKNNLKLSFAPFEFIYGKWGKKNG